MAEDIVLSRSGWQHPVRRPDDDEGLHLLALRGLRDPDISLAVLRGDKARIARAIAEALAQAVDQEVDVALAGVRSLATEMLGKLLAGLQLARAAREVQEQRALLATKPHLRAVRTLCGQHLPIERQIVIADDRQCALAFGFRQRAVNMARR
ncbi:MAG: hypothetical protein WDN31_23020 [Hyphomicrobium sp.]